MAAQTITTNQNHDALTGRAAGENININSFAVLTINSEPQHTAMGLLGSIIATEGQVQIDSRSTRHLTYTGSAGALTAGQTVTGGTSGATGIVLRDMTGTIKFKSVTGTFQNGEALANGAGWTATSSGADTVGTLHVMAMNSKFMSSIRTGLIELNGTWLQLGTSTGLASQTLTNWHTGLIGGVWVETFAGSNIYEIWPNIDGMAFTDCGNADAGKVCKQSFGSTTITFGDGTNGVIPPLGVKIRVPNLYLSSAPSGTTPTTQPATTARFRCTITNLGSFKSNIADLGQFYIEAFSFYECVLTDTVTSGACYFYAGATRVLATRFGVGMYQTTAYTAITVERSNQGALFVNCVALTKQTRNHIIRSENVTIEGGMYCNIGAPASTYLAWFFQYSSNILVKDSYLIGTLQLQNALNVTVQDTRMRFQMPNAQSSYTSLDMINVNGESKDITFDNFIFEVDALPRQYLFNISDSKNVILKNMGSYSAPINMQAQTYCPLVLSIRANNFLMYNCHFINIRSFNIAGNTVSSVQTFQNCTFDNDKRIDPEVSVAVMKGIRASDGTLNGANGIEADVNQVFDTNFGDYFITNTTGKLALYMTEKYLRNNYTVIAGTPKFNGTGQIVMALNDEVEFVWSYFVKGYLSFTNSDYEAVYSGTITIDKTEYLVRYDIDTGSGFSGSYTTMTGANLSAVTIDPATGFKLKIRIKKTGSGTTDAKSKILALAIPMTTSLLAQQSNLYDVVTTDTDTRVCMTKEEYIALRKAGI